MLNDSKKTEKLESESNIKLSLEELKLYNIFLEEYNDIFPKILSLNKKTIFSKIITNTTLLLGKEKISSYSKIQLAKIQSYLKQKNYMPDILSMKKVREIILSTSTKNNNFPYLKLNEINQHCENTSKCYHKCGNELLKIPNYNYIICLFCKEIYKKNQIHLFCKECIEDYYSEFLNIENNENEQIEDYEKATWEEYHCKNYFYYEDMKCPKCNQGLYFSKKRKILKCFNCKFKNKICNTKFKCEKCGIDFNSNCKEYIKFENKPLRISVKETLLNKIFAKPERIPCCNINVDNIKFFIHDFNECNGELLIGNLQGKKIVVCNLCKFVIDYDKVLWFCPQCKKNFNITPSQPKIIEKKFENHNSNIDNDVFNYENPTENNLNNNINNENNFVQSVFKKVNSNCLNEKIHRIIIENSNSNKNIISNSNFNNYPRSPISSNNNFIKYPSTNHLRLIQKRNSLNIFPSEFNLSNISNLIDDNNSLINKKFEEKRINTTQNKNNVLLTTENQNNNKINTEYNFQEKNNIIEQRNKNKENSAKNLSNLSSIFKNINLNLNLNININNIIQNNTTIQNDFNRNNEKIKLSKLNLLEPDENFNPEDFIINKQLGEGAFGKIYSTTWIKNNKEYALKKIILPSLDEIESVKNEYNLVINFIKKTNCNGIIKVYGSQYKKLEEGNYGFFVLMELAFTDWEEEIKKRYENKNYYTEGQLIQILKNLIKTFSELQKNNITHRDIKPQNILIVNNEYKICDFGEAKIINENNENKIDKNDNNEFMIRGTELYMSPILFYALKKKKNKVFHNCFKSDVFSLGMCMIFASTLTFHSLYNVREIKNMDNFKNILARYLVARYSMNFVNLILKMVEIDEKKRPDFIELERDLRD